MYKEKNEAFFKEVLRKAIEASESTMPHFIPLEGVEFLNDTFKRFPMTSVTQLLNNTINSANEVYLANHKPERNGNVYTKDIDCLVGTTAYTAYTLNVMWARKSVIESIGDVLNDPQNADWIKENGFSPKDFEPLTRELKEYTLEAIRSNEKTKPMGDFINTVENKIENEEGYGNYEKVVDRMGLFVQFMNNEIDQLSVELRLNETMHYSMNLYRIFKESYNQICDGKHDVDLAKDITHYANFLEIGHEITDPDMAFFDYHTTDLSNKPIVEDFVKDIGVMLDSENVVILYGDKVHPTDFLDHYNEGTLSEEERNWAHERFDRMKYSLIGKFNSEDDQNNHEIDVDCFYSNGEPIITKEEWEKAKQSTGKYDDDAMAKMEEKIIAKMLSGDEITVKTKDKSMQTTLNPMITPPEKAEFKFGQILQWLYEFFFTNKSKETAKVNAMNERFEKNAFAPNLSRVSVKFNDLADNGVIRGLPRTNKPATHEKTNERKAPQK